MEEFVQGVVSVVLVIASYYIISAGFSIKPDYMSYILGSMVGLGIGYALSKGD